MSMSGCGPSAANTLIRWSCMPSAGGCRHARWCWSAWSAARLEEALAGFPDLPVQSRDHRRAAVLVQRLRASHMALSPWQALLWAIAERIRGQIWSQDRHWQALRPLGCPVV